MKAYTNPQQGKILAEILPPETADMYWIDIKENGFWKAEIIQGIYEPYSTNTPCWSLAALLDTLPTLDDRNPIICKDVRYDKWHIVYHSTASLNLVETDCYDNLIDACVDMIVNLYEQNLL